MCFGVIASGFSSFLAAVLEQDVGLARSTVSYIYIGMGLASIVGAPTMGLVSDRVGRRSALLAVMIAMAVGSLVIAFAPTAAVVVGVIAFGGLWASYPTLTATYVRDHLDAREFNAAYGVMTIFYGLASILPPLLVGVLADELGNFTAVYLVIAATAGIGVVIVGGIPVTSPATQR